MTSLKEIRKRLKLSPGVATDDPRIWEMWATYCRDVRFLLKLIDRYPVIKKDLAEEAKEGR